MEQSLDKLDASFEKLGNSVNNLNASLNSRDKSINIRERKLDELISSYYQRDNGIKEALERINNRLDMISSQ